jgi:hypothetical protein
MLTWGAFNIIGANQRTRTEIAKVQREVAADGIDDTGKFDQRAIACGLDDTAMMTGDRRVNQLTASLLAELQPGVHLD